MKTIVVAGTCSGVGKSTIAAGLMAAYSRRGLRVQPFKIGPDFQDPIHHTAATGRQSCNLDMWMLSREANLTCFGRCISNTDVAIVEGIMGLYDGYDGKSEQGSTAEMAKLLSASVLLVFDCWAFGRSAAAMLRGYTTFDPDVKFAGVILNKVSGPSHTSCLGQAFSLAETKIHVFGGIPKIGELQGFEQNGLRNWDKSVAYMHELADLVELYVDLDAVLEEAASCDPECNFEAFSSETLYHISSPSCSFSKHVRIGIAQDAAFCFHYHENIFLLQDAGAELVYFSPLEDPLPSSLDAIFFGGGHIDPYLEQLSANKQLLYAVKAFADAGGLVYGESCGLMYLSQGVEGLDMQLFSLSGVLPFWTRFGGKLRSSYVKVKPRENCVFIPAEIGEIRGFLCSSIEIFYQDGSSVDSCCKGFVLKDESTADTEWEGYMHSNTICTLVHLHFGSNPRLAHALVDRCRVDRTRAAAVAAASASAVAKAGPEAAAAAGAAAAEAVTAALGEPPRELVPYYGLDMANRREDPSYHLSQYMSIPRLALPFRQQSSDDNSLSETGSCSQTCRFSQLDSQEEGVLRRTESFDLHQLRSTSVEVHDCKLPRSESEIWDSQKGRYISNYSLKDISNNTACGTVRTDHRHRCGKSNSVDFGDENCLVPTHGRHISEDYTERARTQFPSNSKVSKWHCNGNAFMNQVPGHFSLSFRFSGSSQHQDYAKKIVSLLPSVTEILIELGAGSRLVAVTDCCERPSRVQDGRHIVSRSRMDLSPGSNRNLETAGDWKPYLGSLGRKGSKLKLDISWLSRVKPDLVVTEDSSEDGLDNRTLISAFTQAGLHPGKNTELQFFNPCKVSEVFDSILELGDAVGLYSEASLLVSQLRARLRKVAASVAHQGRPRVLLLQGLNPLFLGGHWIPELEELAGGYDSLQKPGSTVEMLHWQRIISYAPEVLVLAPCTSNIEQTLSQVELLARLHGFWSIPAVESGRVYICEHACFSSPGPRMVNGVELLASILHPFVTLGIQVQETAWKLHLNYGQRCSPQDLPKHFKPCL